MQKNFTEKGKKLKSLDRNSFFKIIDENPHVGILIYQNNEIIYANKKVSKMSGYSIEEIENMDILDFLAIKSKDNVRELINFFKNNPNKQNLRINIKKKDGLIINTLVAVSYITLKSKEATLINVIEVTKERLYEDFQMLVDFSNKLIVSEYSEKDYIEKLIHKLNGIYLEKYALKVKAFCGEVNENNKIRIFSSSNEWIDLSFLGKNTLEGFKKNEIQTGSIEIKEIPIKEYKKLTGEKNIKFYVMPIKSNRKIKYVVIIFSEMSGFFNDRDRNLVARVFKNIIESALKKISEERDTKILYKALENSPNWVLITDRNGNILYANKTVERLSGYTLEEILGKNPRIFKSGYQDKKLYKKLWESITSGKVFECVMLNRKKNGEYFKLQYSIIPVKTKGKINNFVAIGIDVSREEKLEGEVFRLKFHDSLTGVYNRYGIKSEIHKMINKLKENYIGIVALVDISGFSQTNTIFSHYVGDQILVEVSNLLKDTFSESSIGRIDGDKFVLFKVIKESELFNFVCKFIPLFKSKRFTDMHLQVGINVGISVFPNDAKDAEELLINANSALKIAKTTGRERNNVKIFDTKISKDMEEMNKKMNLIVDAYENDWFEIFLQPYFDTKNIKLVGFESLLRIRHPEKGIIPPGFFINTLEKSEFLFEIEEKIIQKVSRITEEWKRKSYIVKPISINITAKSFAHSNTIKTLKKYANGNINIEIIERILVDNKEYTQKILKELKEFNIKCFLDDFGTGYSSLSYITSMPIDVIKIDISFIKKFLEDRKTCMIVESIINLSKKLGIKTVAEGVETELQFKELKKLGCDMIQGYLFAKPVPYKEAEKWLKTE